MISLTKQAYLISIGCARGEIEAYGGAVDAVIPSVTDAEQEQEALNAAVQAGIDSTSGDPLADYVDGLGLTSEAADGATAAVTNVTQATRDATADIDAANQRLTDFDIALERPTATFPRLASALREFTGTAPDIDRVTEAVERTTQSVDDLLDEIEAVGDGTEHIEPIAESFRDLADRTVPNVTRDIVDAFVAIAEDGEIDDAFGRLGENLGETLVDELSAVLSEQLSLSITSEIESAAADGGILSAAGSLGTATGAVVAASTAGHCCGVGGEYLWLSNS